MLLRSVLRKGLAWLPGKLTNEELGVVADGDVASANFGETKTSALTITAGSNFPDTRAGETGNVTLVMTAAEAGDRITWTLSGTACDSGYLDCN